MKFKSLSEKFCRIFHLTLTGRTCFSITQNMCWKGISNNVPSEWRLNDYSVQDRIAAIAFEITQTEDDRWNAKNKYF